jgi:hypothetical protein
MTLPDGFPFKTNNGLHGDMLFFETGQKQFITVEPVIDDEAGSITFSYETCDSDEGVVTITYFSIDGDPVNTVEDGCFDVEISTSSDVWGLAQTATAISEAIALHRALGVGQRYDRDHK